jgi:hypothetical protein
LVERVIGAPVRRSKDTRKRLALLGCLWLCVAALAPGASIAADGARLVSEVRAITPAVEGVDAEVVGGDYQLLLTNRSRETVIVKGYDGESYLRFLPDGEVQVNDNSAARYVNADRLGQTSIPEDITPQSPVKWRRVATGGSYRWIDHRIHLTERGTPPQVKDENKRTKIFDWRVPLKVNGRPSRVAGTLTWTPKSSSGSSGDLIIALAALALALAVFVLAVWRRRRRAAGAAPREKAPKEAW